MAITAGDGGGDGDDVDTNSWASGQQDGWRSLGGPGKPSPGRRSTRLRGGGGGAPVKTIDGVCRVARMAVGVGPCPAVVPAAAGWSSTAALPVRHRG